MEVWEGDGINQGTPNIYSIETQAKLLQYFINEKNVLSVALDLAKGCNYHYKNRLLQHVMEGDFKTFFA
jgi:hypothetical protein